MTQLNYNESIQGFPSYRAFIAGFEVTEDCVDIGSNWSAGRAPSFASFQLLNLNDKYIMRREDLVILHPSQVFPLVNQSPDSDLAKIYDLVINQNQRILDSANDPTSIKYKVITKKQHPAYQITTNPIDPFTGNSLGAQQADIYPFIEGKSIFHQNDPVRIFVQDPFDPQVWYFWFSGSVTKIGDDVSGTNLEKTITINCEDVSKSLRYARYTINPGLRDPNQISTQEDLITFNGFTTPLSGHSLPEAADIVVFGDVGKDGLPDSALISVPVVARDGSTFNRIMSKTAAGNFKFLDPTKRIYTLAKSANPRRSTITLKNWQDQVLNHVVDVTDLEILRARSDNPETASQVLTRLENAVAVAQANGTFGASLTQQIITEIGTDPANYPVDGGTLYMLLPEGLDQLGTDVVAKEFVSSIAMVSEFKDRRSLMYDLVDRVEFVFYADPKGNLVVEFPLFDFDPDDFSDVSVQGKKHTSQDALVPDSVRFTIIAPSGTVSFDNEKRFIIEDETVESFGATDDDAPVKTVCLTVPVVTRSEQALTGNSLQNAVRNPLAVRLDALIPIYGARFIQGDSRKTVETERAALISSAIELNKANANAYTIKLTMLPRFAAWLNRPMLFRHRNHIGTAMSIAHKITWGSGISTTIGLGYLRGWTGEVDTAAARLIYKPIGGAQSRPINYAELFAHVKTTNSLPPTTTSGSGTQSR